MQLEGKTALITGAGRGIGKALALGFAREGANIIAISRTSGEIEATAGEVTRLGARAAALAADVSQVEDVRRIADAAVRRFGRLDVLINNAALRMNQLGGPFAASHHPEARGASDRNLSSQRQALDNRRLPSGADGMALIGDIRRGWSRAHSRMRRDPCP